MQRNIPIPNNEKQEGKIYAAKLSSGEKVSVSSKNDDKEPKKEVKPQTVIADIRNESDETVRIPLSKLDSVRLQSEEMIPVKMTIRKHVNDILEITNMISQWQKKWMEAFKSGSKKRDYTDKTLLSQTPKNDRNSGVITLSTDFFQWNSKFIKNMESSIELLATSVTDNGRSINGMIDTMLSTVKEMMMFPFLSLFVLFPKLVLDLAREQSKEIELNISGETVEMDKRILQEMKDPLTHIIRNCIDHGIEDPEVRKEHGKPRSAKIDISVSYRDSDKVDIIIKDDGAGIDIAKVRASAVKHGSVTDEEVYGMSEKEALNLIFKSGVSTSKMINTISGRGLGMAIVKERMEKLGGQLNILTEYGKGTEFHITLPLSIATFRGIIIKAAGETFTIPTVSVKRVTTVKRVDIKTTENKTTLHLDGKVVPFIMLSEVLHLPSAKDDKKLSSVIPIILIKSVIDEVAFGIDDVIREDDVLVKPLGKQHQKVRNIAGASVMGDGSVVLILDPGDLLKSASMSSLTAVKGAHGKAVADERRSILVVEDSITARSLIKNILESEGYLVSDRKGFKYLQEST